MKPCSGNKSLDGGLKTGERKPCPRCGFPIVWDTPYGYGKWVHA